MKKFILSAMALLACAQAMAMNEWNRDLWNKRVESGLQEGITQNADKYVQERFANAASLEKAKWCQAYTAYALERIKNGAPRNQVLTENSGSDDAISQYYANNELQSCEQSEKITKDIEAIRNAISLGNIAVVVKKDDSQSE